MIVIAILIVLIVGAVLLIKGLKRKQALQDSIDALDNLDIEEKIVDNLNKAEKKVEQINKKLDKQETK